MVSGLNRCLVGGILFLATACSVSLTDTPESVSEPSSPPKPLVEISNDNKLTIYRFGAGSYNINEPYILGDNTSVICSAVSTSERTSIIPSEGKGAFRIIGSKNVSIENCAIHGQGNVDGYTSSNENLIEVAPDSQGNKPESIRLSNLVLNNTRGEAAIKIINSNRVVLNTINIQGYAYAGVMVLGDSQDIMIANSRMNRSMPSGQGLHNPGGRERPPAYLSHGLLIDAKAADWPANNVAEKYPININIMGNQCTANPTGHCFTTYGGKNISFVGNRAFDSINCFIADFKDKGPQTEMTNLVFRGNSCQGLQSASLGVTPYASGIYINGASATRRVSALTISQNMIRQVSGGTTDNRSSVWVENATGVSIRDNKVYTGPTGGIRLAQNIEEFEMFDNEIMDAQSVGIILGSNVTGKGVSFRNNLVHSPSSLTLTGIQFESPPSYLDATGNNSRFCVSTPSNSPSSTLFDNGCPSSD